MSEKSLLGSLRHTEKTSEHELRDNFFIIILLPTFS